MSLLIGKFSDLATKEEFREITTGISDLNKKVDIMTPKFTGFEPCVATNEEGILKIKSEIKEFKQCSTTPN